MESLRVFRLIRCFKSRPDGFLFYVATEGIEQPGADVCLIRMGGVSNVFMSGLLLSDGVEYPCSTYRAVPNDCGSYDFVVWVRFTIGWEFSRSLRLWCEEQGVLEFPTIGVGEEFYKLGFPRVS